jgi:hypothetical protein
VKEFDALAKTQAEEDAKSHKDGIQAKGNGKPNRAIDNADQLLEELRKLADQEAAAAHETSIKPKPANAAESNDDVDDGPDGVPDNPPVNKRAGGSAHFYRNGEKTIADARTVTWPSTRIILGSR